MKEVDVSIGRKPFFSRVRSWITISRYIFFRGELYVEETF